MSKSEDAAYELVQAVHSADGWVCLALAGAGTRALAWLFGEPGASRTMLDAQVPYASSAVDEYLGDTPDQYASAETALRMAKAALRRARNLALKSGRPDSAPLGGIACTAALVTDRVRRGQDRCHVAVATSAGVRKIYSLEMAKGRRNRAGEELLCSQLVLNAVAEAKGLKARLSLRLLASEQVQISGR